MIKKFEEFVNENYTECELRSKIAKELSEVLETEEAFVDKNRELLFSTAESFDDAGRAEFDNRVSLVKYSREKMLIEDLKIKDPNKILFFGESMPIMAYVYEENEEEEAKRQSKLDKFLGIRRLKLEGINRELIFCFVVPDAMNK